MRELEQAASAAAASHDRSSLSSSAAISPQPPEAVFSAPLLPSTAGAARSSGTPAGSGLAGGSIYGVSHASPPTLRLPSLRVSTVASTWERTGRASSSASERVMRRLLPLLTTCLARPAAHRRRPRGRANREGGSDPRRSDAAQWSAATATAAAISRRAEPCVDGDPSLNIRALPADRLA